VVLDIVRRAAVASVVLLGSTGCAYITHTEALVRDPREVEARIIRHEDEDWLSNHIVRKADGALEYKGQYAGDPDVLVSARGWMTSADAFGRAPDLASSLFTLPVRSARPGGRSTRSVAFSLITPSSNVLAVRERREPDRFLGWTLTVGGAGLGFLSALSIAHARDSPAYLPVGVALAIPAALGLAAGVWQLLAAKGQSVDIPCCNEQPGSTNHP
jgi:hypothetical protein